MIAKLAAAALLSVVAIPALAIHLALPAMEPSLVILTGADKAICVFEIAGPARPFLSGLI